MKKFFQVLLVSLGCLHLAGGPYSLMQAYAWAGMLVSYSQDGGLFQAARDTFSGEKPCELCHKIAAAKERSPEPVDEPLAPHAAGKLLQEMIPAEGVVACRPRGSDLMAEDFAGMIPLPGSGGAAPPTPPPRSLG